MIIFGLPLQSASAEPEHSYLHREDVLSDDAGVGKFDLATLDPDRDLCGHRRSFRLEVSGQP